MHSASRVAHGGILYIFLLQFWAHYGVKSEWFSSRAMSYKFLSPKSPTDLHLTERQSTDALLIFHRSCSCDKDNCRVSSSCCSSFSLLHCHIERETPHKSTSSFSTLIYAVLSLYFPMQIFVFRTWQATCYFSSKYSC